MNKYLFKFIMIICFISFLFACTPKKQIVFKDRIKEVPVIMVEPYPRPADIKEIDNLPVDELSIQDKDDHEKISEAYVLSIRILEAKILEYKEALRPYYSTFNENNEE